MVYALQMYPRHVSRKLRTLIVTSTAGALAALVLLSSAVAAEAYPTRLGGVSLAWPGTDYAVSSVISPDGRYGYFGSYTNPGRVVRVRLSDMTEEAGVTLNSGEGELTSALISSDGTYGYFGTVSGRVVKVNLSSMTRVGAVQLNAGETGLRGAVRSQDGNFGYFSTYASAGRLVKVQLSTMERVGASTDIPDAHQVHWAMGAPGGEYAYLTTQTSPGRVIKMRLSDLTKVGATMVLSAGDDDIRSGVVSPDGDYAYVATMSGDPARVIKIRLSDMSKVGSASLGAGEVIANSAIISPDGASVYFATQTAPARIAKITTATMTLDSPTLRLAAGENSVGTALIDPAGTFAYFGTITSPAKVVKVQLADRPPSPSPSPSPSPGGGGGTTPDEGDVDLDPVECPLAPEPPTGPLGISINSGDDYTNSVKVKIRLIWPSCADRVVLSNDGGFEPAKVLEAQERVTWKLRSSGAERLPKIAYARYLAEGENASALSDPDKQTFFDDIILDQTAPRIVSAVVVGRGSASASIRLAVYRLRVKASDRTSGLAAVQAAIAKSRPLASQKYATSLKVKAGSRPRWVRVRDGAGNWSRWRALR